MICNNFESNKFIVNYMCCINFESNDFFVHYTYWFYSIQFMPKVWLLHSLCIISSIEMTARGHMAIDFSLDIPC